MDKIKFNYQINGLRAFLLLFVVLSHYTFVFFKNVVPPEIGGPDSFTSFFGQHIANNLGAASVCIFFFLSGYFLSIKSTKEYALKKLFSIFIPLIICLVIIYVCRLIFSSYHIGFLDLSMNFLIIPMASNLFAYIDGAHWYIFQLCLFFVYYLLMHLLSILIKKNITFYLMVFLTMLSLGASLLPDGKTVFSICKALFFQGISFIALGYFTRMFIDKKLPFKNKYYVGLFMFLILMITMVTAYLRYDWTKMITYLFLLSITCLCLINKIKFLETKPFQIVGSSSFIMYIVHQELGYLIIYRFYELNLYWLGVFVALLGLFGFSLLFAFLWNKKALPKIYNSLFGKKLPQQE